MSQTMPLAAVEERLAPPSTEGTVFEQDAIFGRSQRNSEGSENFLGHLHGCNGPSLPPDTAHVSPCFKRTQMGGGGG
jgi:hypothetical protein